MTEFIPAEKGVPIRYPSTANLMLDSADRRAGDSEWNFTINRNASILNGFFTRIGTTEVVLEWGNYNISTDLGNTSITLWFNNQTETLTLEPGYYTVETCLDTIIFLANQAYGANTFQIYNTLGQVGIETQGGGNFYIVGAPNDLTLANQLGFVNGVVTSDNFQVASNPDLRPFRYLDFVSPQLTYNQELKDGTTNVTVRDALCRWYFAWDTPPTLDGYGQPIQMGYTPFKVRRTFNPPKQIKWNSNQPVGQLGFEVYGYSALYPRGVLLSTIFSANTLPESEWLMTLQVSEV